HRGFVVLWEVAGWRVRAAARCFRFGITCLAFSPDGGALISGDEGYRVLVWDSELQVRGQYRPRWPRPWGVAFTPDGRSLGACCGDRGWFTLMGGVALWDRETGATRWDQTVAGGGGLALAYAPDGQTLAVGTGALGVQLHDPASGAVRASLPQEVG